MNSQLTPAQIAKHIANSDFEHDDVNEYLSHELEKESYRKPYSVYQNCIKTWVDVEDVEIITVEEGLYGDEATFNCLACGERQKSLIVSGRPA
jgi:hypothetical protein